jgi:hypothetical protein
VADDLVGDMDAAASGVFGLRTDQSTWPPTGAKGTNGTIRALAA